MMVSSPNRPDKDESPTDIKRTKSHRLKALASSIRPSRWGLKRDKCTARNQILEIQSREEKQLKKQLRLLEAAERQERKSRRDFPERGSSSRISSLSRRSWTSHGSGDSVLRRLSRRSSRGRESYGPLPSPSDISDKFDNIPTVSRVYNKIEQRGGDSRTYSGLQSQFPGDFGSQVGQRFFASRGRRHTDSEMMPIADELFIDQPSQANNEGDQRRSRPSKGEINTRYFRDSARSSNHRRSKSANPRAQSRPRYYEAMNAANGLTNGNEHRQYQEPPVPPNPNLTSSHTKRSPTHTPPRQLVVTNPGPSPTSTPRSNERERPQSQPSQDVGRRSTAYQVSNHSIQQLPGQDGPVNPGNHHAHSRSTSAPGSQVAPETLKQAPRFSPGTNGPKLSLTASPPPLVSLPANLVPGPEDRRVVSTPVRQPSSQPSQAPNNMSFARQSIFDGPLLVKKDAQSFTKPASTTTARPFVAYNAFSPQVQVKHQSSAANQPQPETQSADAQSAQGCSIASPIPPMPSNKTSIGQ
ncbi:hypothetical protein AAP_00328 [Ascosphaera apis ARSEF 7405]|uniref:Uncharacterized protein n=1 Tax=Ascosphaera apis ARSEF 7405 TaxID=392613 RepID=A0A168DSP6_9EURO|nr:hypothetical protein AAP_00328 [Ascosphaera apis ARSEF 7405]